MDVKLVLPAAQGRLVILRETAKLTQAAALFGQHHTDLIVICNDVGKMVGVLSKTDIVSRISQCNGGACTALVASVMARKVVCCRPSDSLQQAWSLMKQTGFLHIPIIDSEDNPLGTLYARDALQALLGEVEDEDVLLREYIMGIGYH